MNPENPEITDATEQPGYWRGKNPCWLLLGCPVAMRQHCDAFLHPQMPCWEQHATLCEAVLRIPKDCLRCIVYKAYHYQDAEDESAWLE